VLRRRFLCVLGAFAAPEAKYDRIRRSWARSHCPPERPVVVTATDRLQRGGVRVAAPRPVAVEEVRSPGFAAGVAARPRRQVGVEPAGGRWAEGLVHGVTSGGLEGSGWHDGRPGPLPCAFFEMGRPGALVAGAAPVLNHPAVR